MKRYLIILMLLSSAVMSVPAGAVELQQGWYAWIQAAYLEGGEDSGAIHSAYWYPTSSLGQFGSFLVTDPDHGGLGRKIAVTDNVSVPSGVIFEDAGTFNGRGLAYQTMELSWETDYDSTKMLLQLLKRRVGQADELVWQQTASGHQYVGSNHTIYFSAVPGDQVVFRVVAIPEPAGLASLTCALAGLLWRSRRRR